MIALCGTSQSGDAPARPRRATLRRAGQREPAAARLIAVEASPGRRRSPRCRSRPPRPTRHRERQRAFPDRRGGRRRAPLGRRSSSSRSTPRTPHPLREDRPPRRRPPGRQRADARLVHARDALDARLAHGARSRVSVSPVRRAAAHARSAEPPLTAAARLRSGSTSTSTNAVAGRRVPGTMFRPGPRGHARPAPVSDSQLPKWCSATAAAWISPR